jgi:hypothetical protein
MRMRRDESEGGYRGPPPRFASLRQVAHSWGSHATSPARMIGPVRTACHMWC